MTRRDCLTPPPEGSREREIVDRFADVLAEVGPRPVAGEVRTISAAKAYRLHFLVWRLESFSKGR